MFVNEDITHNELEIRLKKIREDIIGLNKKQGDLEEENH